MRLFTYIIVHDLGFAPNPFWGYCTLACCKPVIRRTAAKGDWIVGISPKNSGNRLIYAMKVTEEPMPFAEYFADPRFKDKKPAFGKGDRLRRWGDNIYQPMGDGTYKQLRSQHSHPNGDEKLFDKRRDLSGQYVLISDHFHYFGSASVKIPKSLQHTIPQRAHKCRFTDKTIQDFIRFVSRHPKGLIGSPSAWPRSLQAAFSRITHCGK